MPRRQTLAGHLTIDELERRYRESADRVERTRLQAIWMISQGKSVREVAATVDYTEAWVRRLVRRYNDGGPGALVDQRHDNPGAAPLLSYALQAELAVALKSPPADGGPWTSRKVADWIESRTGQRTYPQRGWAYLKRLSNGTTNGTANGHGTA